MRILYVTPYPPARDGIGDYAERLLQAVRERGHEARVIGARPAGGPAPHEVMAALPRAPLQRDALVQRIAGWRPDVVHVQFAIAAFGARLPALLGLLRALCPLDARVVVTLHEVTRDTASLRAPGRAVYRRVAAQGDLSLVHTRTALDELTGRIGVAPQCVALVPHPHTELP